jgi:spore coat protein CotH
MGAILAAGPYDGQPTRGLLGIEQNADALFDDSALHEIRLVVNSQDWQALKERFLENTYYPADLQWKGRVVRNVGIRSRGTGSRSGVKPGLKVDFDRYSSTQKFLGLKSLVLRNNTQDESNLHERLSMLLFERMGFPVSREAHTTLYVNNEYAGVYTIVETVDKTFLERTLGEDDGYLYEYEYPVGAQPYYFEYKGSDPALYVPMPFKPDTHESNPRPEFIEQLVWTINETSSAVFRTAISEYIDLEQFIRHVAIESFLADTDGLIGDVGMNNFYFYRYDNRKLFTFIAWDKSEAFRGGFDAPIFHNITGLPSWQQNRLLSRALAHPDLVDLYLETLLACARVAAEPDASSPNGAGWLEREVQREYEQIRDAVYPDPVKPFTNDQFEGGVERLRVFARNRSAFVRQEVAAVRETGSATASAYRQSPPPASRND